MVLENTQRRVCTLQKPFALVSKMVTVRTFSSIAAAHNWEVHQMDVLPSCMVTCMRKFTCGLHPNFRHLVLIKLVVCTSLYVVSNRCLVAGFLNLLPLIVSVVSLNHMLITLFLLMQKRMGFFFVFLYMWMILSFLAIILLPLQNLKHT